MCCVLYLLCACVQATVLEDRNRRIRDKRKHSMRRFSVKETKEVQRLSSGDVPDSRAYGTAVLHGNRNVVLFGGMKTGSSDASSSVFFKRDTCVGHTDHGR